MATFETRIVWESSELSLAQWVKSETVGLGLARITQSRRNYYYLKILLRPFIFQLLLFFSSIPDCTFSHQQYPLEPQTHFYPLFILPPSTGNVNMSVCFPNSQSSISAVVLKGRTPLLMSSNIHGLWSQGISTSFSSTLFPGKSEINHVGLSICTKLSCSTVMGQTIRGGFRGSCCSKQRGNTRFFSSVIPRKRYHEISLAWQSMNMRLLVPKQKMLHKIKCNLGPVNWPRGCASVGLIFGLLVCSFSSEPAHAEAHSENENRKDDCNEYESNVKFSHGKKVYTDYSVIGIPGDGRCLFRSVARGACLRSGRPPPSESTQRELADDLRARVADEFIKRREETEWKPHVWGGEPELFIASHVLQMPITVYMYDKDAGGLISIAEYGQEYGKENPIRVLYHGFGHYDALEIPKRKDPKPRL
ncbi:OTU domain-containing protein, partial [Mucuna pruriens]